MQNLPIGIQSFANLRRDDCLYVDKTEDIHRLITSGRVFFLSRPRRFGKSLLVSTMEAIFKGNKALFKGLWIENNWDWTQ
uniref:AAA family ATPase n=1 Tax=Candidatus Symbiothrix dinenymphae TaxID=467085 RepID=UPI000AB7B435